MVSLFIVLALLYFAPEDPILCFLSDLICYLFFSSNNALNVCGMCHKFLSARGQMLLITRLRFLTVLDYYDSWRILFNFKGFLWSGLLTISLVVKQKENVHFDDITNLFLVYIFDSVLPRLY